MNTKVVTIFVAVLLASGCATRPISNAEATLVPNDRLLSSDYSAPSAQTTKITIKRDAGISGSACVTRIFLNAKPIADINSAEKIELFLNDGDYIISAWPGSICGGGMSEAKATVKIGVDLNFRVGYGSNGDFYLNPTAF